MNRQSTPQRPLRSQHMSRRAFLGLGASAAAAASAAALGCSSSASVSTEAIDTTSNGTTATSNIAADDTTTPNFLQIPDTIPDSLIRETYDADLVIIGAGLSGLAAARAASEAGATNIIVLEKAETWQCRSNEIGTVGGSVQEQSAEAALDGNEIVSALMKECGYRPDQRILKLWADNSGEALDWFLQPCEGDYVIEEESAAYDGESLSVRRLHWPLPDGADTASNYYPVFSTSQALLPSLASYLEYTYNVCVENGVQFLFSSWGRQLVRGDESDRIEAVIFEGLDGEYRKINVTTAVLLATGDYASNSEMLTYYSRWAASLDNAWPNVDANGTNTNTGDGQRMGIWAGGRFESGPHAVMTMQIGGPLGVDGFLLVDGRGQRFVNEDVGSQWLQNQISRLPGQQAWQIFDSLWPDQIAAMDAGFGNVNHYVESGSDVPNGSYLKNAYISSESSEDGNTPGFDSYFESDAAGVTAETIEGLALLMDVDSESLAATIERYNELANNGADTDFNKRADRLFPVSEPPFYAYPITNSSLYACMGGLVTNSDFQALDAETNDPIEGLYAVGNCQGGRFLVDYPTAAPGISHGMALTHGMLVGRILAAAVSEQLGEEETASETNEGESEGDDEETASVEETASAEEASSTEETASAED